MTIMMLIFSIVAVVAMCRLLDPCQVISGGLGLISIPVVMGGMGIAADLLLWAADTGWKLPVALVGVMLTWLCMGIAGYFLVKRCKEVDPKEAKTFFNAKKKDLMKKQKEDTPFRPFGSKDADWDRFDEALKGTKQ